MIYEVGDEEFLPQETVNEIIDLLKQNKITILILANSGIDSEYAKALSEGLRENTSLLYLNLSCNKYIADGGMYHVLKALENHPSLLAFRMDKTGCSGDLAPYLRDFIETNKRLRFFSLEGADFAHESIEKVAGALKKNKTLMAIYLPMEILVETPPFYATMEWHYKASSLSKTLQDVASSNTALCDMDTHGVDVVPRRVIAEKLAENMSSSQEAEAIRPEFMSFIEYDRSLYSIIKKLNDNYKKQSADKITQTSLLNEMLQANVLSEQINQLSFSQPRLKEEPKGFDGVSAIISPKRKPSPTKV